MAQIPLGNFRQTNVQPEVAQNRVIAADPNAQNRANQQVAGALQNIGLNILDQRNREEQALSRVKADNALIDRESQIKTITSDLDEQMRTGKLAYDKAPEAYNAAVSKLDPLDTPGLDPAQQGSMNNVLKRMQIRGLEGVQQSVEKGRIQSAQSELVSRMDMLGKDAAMPGANVEQINSRMDAEDVEVAGRLAFGETWAHKKQEFKDGNWMTHATQRVIESRESIGSLQKLEHDLTAEDGFYARKLDPQKRNQLLSTVTGRIFQVQEHNQRQAEIREVRAERILGQIDRQAASGVPAPPALLQQWASGVKGTSAAGEFNQRVGQMNEVQQVMRLPVADQQTYIQQKRQQFAANGASVDQVTNLDRLDRAVTSNIEQMRDQPLVWNATRTGAPIEPLDFSNIGTPEGQMTLVGQLGGRYDTLNAMRRQVGPEVTRNPFLPQEASMLKAALDQVDDGTKLQILGAIAGAAPSGSDLAGTLKTLAADKPPLLMAGLAQARGLKASDGTAVAPTILRGAKVLADKSSIMPSDTQMSVAFDESVGQSIPAGTQERERAFGVFKSIYAGLAGPAGVVHKKSEEPLNEAVALKAINMATGGIATYAGSKVVKPYGWSDSRFSDSVDSQLQGFAKSTKIPLGSLERLQLFPVTGREGSYYLMNAGRPQADPQTGNPIVVKLQ
ncbi:hypothetical protein FX985_00640 [Pseudomonas extremaustralis]|uniref:Uncharacterized protein n=1 Tax=Pseudomonas extremaustralis TaxID=359110 RepID=A0A5M9IWR3_9PSED|nr:hypothetical protein [Pseudomonas extremaustralis]KAA8560590.1 hypothetical protein FX985_00640 [Pseudomonas extremaustralis]